jgi:hypothetical protein
LERRVGDVVVTRVDQVEETRRAEERRSVGDRLERIIVRSSGVESTAPRTMLRVASRVTMLWEGLGLVLVVAAWVRDFW